MLKTEILKNEGYSEQEVTKGLQDLYKIQNDDEPLCMPSTVWDFIETSLDDENVGELCIVIEYNRLKRK